MKALGGLLHNVPVGVHDEQRNDNVSYVSNEASKGSP